MSTAATLYVGNDSVVEVALLKNELTALELDAATVTVRLRDIEGQDVSGQVWPLTMLYVPASVGTYRATLPYTLPLVPNKRYVATIVADAGPGLRAEWDMQCVALSRT